MEKDETTSTRTLIQPQMKGTQVDSTKFPLR